MEKVTVIDSRQVKNFDKENMEVSLTRTTEHTEPLSIGSIQIEGKFTTTEDLGVTTLKDVDAEISSIQSQIATAQSTLDALNESLQTKQAFRDKIDTEVSRAYEELPAEIQE